METLCRSSHTLDLLGKPQSEPQIEHPALAHATEHVGKIHSKSGIFTWFDYTAKNYQLIYISKFEERALIGLVVQG